MMNCDLIRTKRENLLLKCFLAPHILYFVIIAQIKLTNVLFIKYFCIIY